MTVCCYSDMVESRINMLLTDDETRKFESLRQETGLRTKSEVVRFCINYVYTAYDEEKSRQKQSLTQH